MEASKIRPRTKESRPAVREARLKLSLTQDQASKATGIPLSTIENWESGRGGRTGASRARMEAYAQALQKYAQAQGYDPAEFAPHVVFPGLFAHPLPENGDQRMAGRDARPTSEEDAA